MICTNCGKDNPETNKFCLQCGQPLAVGTTSSTSSQQPHRSSGRLPLIIGGVLLLVALIAAGWFLVSRLTGGGGGREMLLVTPRRNGGFDLSVLRLGDDPTKAVVIAEGADDYGGYLMDNRKPGNPVILSSSGFGNFLPGDKRLVFFYGKGGKMRLMEYALGAESPTEIIGSENGNYIAALMPNSRDLFITDHGSGDVRCYTAAPGAKAERVARTDNCQPTQDGKRLLTFDSNNRGELTLVVANLDGTNKTTLLDDVATSYAEVSADASHVAYASRSDDGYESIVLVDAAGQKLFESNEFIGLDTFGFAGASDTVYFIADNGDGEWELHTSAGGKPLATARAMRVLSAAEEATLAVLTADEEDAGKVTVFNLGTGASTEVASGDNLMLSRIADPPRLLIKEEGDGGLKVTAAEWSGANPVTLFDDNDYGLSDIQVQPGDSRVLLTLFDEEGLNSLYVAPLDGSPGYFILEDWSGFRLYDQSGDTLLFDGSEDSGDAPILYAVTLGPEADLVELDDSADYYRSAFVAPDGRSAIYSAAIGNRFNDIVVRQMRLDGKEQPADLLEGQMLVAARWNPLLFEDIYWNGPGPLAQAPVVEVSGNNARLISLDEISSGVIDQQSFLDLGDNIGTLYGALYYFDGLQGQQVQFDVYGAESIGNSTLDPVAGLLDEEMNLLHDDDDSGTGTDSRLIYILPQDGRYYLVIVNSGGGYDDTFTYQVSMSYP